MKIITDIYTGTLIKQLLDGRAFVAATAEDMRDAVFVTINKLIDGARTARDKDVETYRNFVFEIDNEDLELQKIRAKRLFDEKVINRAVYSGSKSIHCRITLNDEPENKEQYKWIWLKLNKKYFDGLADQQCSNPARLTRRPNAIRKNGAKQERYFLSNEVLDYDWRKDFELSKQLDGLTRPEDKKIIVSDEVKNAFPEIIYENKKTPIELLLKRNIPASARKLLGNSFSDGERHKEIPSAILFLKKCGWELQEIERLVLATGIKDCKNYIKNIFKLGA